ncbi:hypothetical protein JZ751_005985 [Albula glossodonta]|uniref:Uncharacterized protein n=1 Tax=Albula glossodonta TaxID=121402 RepID=A0A8T2PC24_9TELE|nr:hypothetical protein JZ751_005985 [Albula glossodonta]
MQMNTFTEKVEMVRLQGLVPDCGLVMDYTTCFCGKASSLAKYREHGDFQILTKPVPPTHTNPGHTAQIRFSLCLGHSAFSKSVMMMGNTTVAQLLLEHGANPNVPDSHTGATPLHDAAREGFLDTVAILIQYHADIDAKDFQGRRPVDLAEMYGHRNVVAFLKSV